MSEDKTAALEEFGRAGSGSDIEKWRRRAWERMAENLYQAYAQRLEYADISFRGLPGLERQAWIGAVCDVVFNDSEQPDQTEAEKFSRRMTGLHQRIAELTAQRDDYLYRFADLSNGKAVFFGEKALAEYSDWLLNEQSEFRRWREIA